MDHPLISDLIFSNRFPVFTRTGPMRHCLVMADKAANLSSWKWGIAFYCHKLISNQGRPHSLLIERK